MILYKIFLILILLLNIVLTVLLFGMIQYYEEDDFDEEDR